MVTVMVVLIKTGDVDKVDRGEYGMMVLISST